MGDYDGMFSGIDAALKAMFFTLCISVPLGIWKLVEIIIWLFQHINISFV